MKNECAWCHFRFDVHDPEPEVIDHMPFHRTETIKKKDEHGNEIGEDFIGCAHDYRLYCRWIKEHPDERPPRRDPRESFHRRGEAFAPSQERTDF